MQDDSIVKNQQLANQKFTYNKKHDSLGQDQNFKRKKANKGKQRKKHHSNASGLLSFKIEQKEHIPSRISKPPPRVVSDITLSPYYRYSVLPGNYRDYHLDPSLSIDWDTVKKVHILADSEAKCPICLENSLLAARANKCGHYYCWPCVIRYLWLAQGVKKCPVCNDSLRPLDLRPASLYIYQNLSEGVVAEFSLMKRPKGTICVFRQGDNIEPTFDSFPASSSKSSFLNRISIYTDFEEDYVKDKNALVAACLEADEFEKNSIQRALELLEKMNADGMQRCEFMVNRFAGGFYYFYQLCDTQPYFLHPLNVSMMKKQFNEFELFPLTLKAKVIEIERVYITENDQRRHG